MARLVSRSEFARIAGVSPSAATKWAKGAGSKADRNGRVDLDHPATREYLTRKGVAPTAVDAAAAPEASKPTATRPTKGRSRAAKTPEAAAAPAPAQKPPDRQDSAERMRRFVQATAEGVQEMAAEGWPVDGYETFVDLNKKQAETERIELQNAQTRGELVPRAFVESNMFDALDALCGRFLSDMPETLVREVTSRSEAGATTEDLVKFVIGLMGTQIQQLKEHVVRATRRRH